MAITLNDIIEGIYLESKNIDSVFRNKNRYEIVRYAKRGLDQLNLSFATHLMGMNVRVPMSCRVSKPLGYKTFVRAYVLGCDGETIEISRNDKIPDEIYHYLINCDGSIITDSCGNMVRDKCMDCNEGLSHDGCICTSCEGTALCLSKESSNLLRSLEMYKDSWIKAKDKLDYFEFSSDLEDVAIVIEYISDESLELNECMIVVDEEFESALDYFIKFKLLEGGIETMSQSQYYWRKFKMLRDKLNYSRNALSKLDLYSLFTRI